MDHLRGIFVALLVLHRAVLAYCRFSYTNHRHYLLSTAPVVDAQRWGGFDVLATLNDSFFMPLMFLLSGLFVWRGLQHRDAWGYRTVAPLSQLWTQWGGAHEVFRP